MGPKPGKSFAQKGGAQKGGAQKGGAPKGGASKGGRPKISRFFHSPATSFFFFSFSWGSLRGILVFEAPGPEMCTFGVLGLSWGPERWSPEGGGGQRVGPRRVKTTFIKNHFTSKNHFHQKTTFIKKPLSSKPLS